MWRRSIQSVRFSLVEYGGFMMIEAKLAALVSA